MLENIVIPVALQLDFDDLGWHDGRDRSKEGRGTRSGLPRDHVVADYTMMNELGRLLNQKIMGKLCLADWDKDNYLYGEEGITHDPYGWNRAAEIDMDYARECFEEIEKSEYLEYCVHSIMHGRYDETGKCITQRELFQKSETGEWSPLSNEEIDRRLTLFFKIFNSWGFSKKPRVFGSPCGVPEMLTGEQLAGLNCVLYKHGIRYFETHWAFFHTKEECVSYPVKYLASNRRIEIHIPWNAYDVDIEKIPDAVYPGEKNLYGLISLHWTNFLRLDPEENLAQLPRWKAYFDRQSEIFGAMISRDFEFSVMQQFHYQFATVDYNEGEYIIDLSLLHRQNIDRIKREFFISLRRGTEPKGIEGGDIELYEEKKEFKTYKITYSGDRIRVKVQ